VRSGLDESSLDGGDHSDRPRGKNTYRRAVGWSFALNLGQEGMTFLVTLVIAGILGPEAYGIVALAAVYILLMQMLLQSMIPAVVQRPALTDADKDTAFWMTFAAALFFAAGSIALSGWWASINGVPELRSVVMALSLLVVVKGLVVVQEALLRRAMDFGPLALRTNVSVLVGGVVGIGLAIGGAGVWALVGQQLTTGVVELAVLWSDTSWRPRWRFHADSARGLARFSGASAVGSIGVFLNNRSDVLLMGLFFGAAAVGLYRLASRIVESVANLLMVSLQAVALPEFSRYQDDEDRFAGRLVVLVRTGAMLALPTLGIIVACSTPIMGLLGDQWDPAARVLAVLCVVGGVRAVTAFSGPMLQAQGRPGLGAGLAWLAGGLSAITFVVTGVALRDADIVDQVFWMAISRALLFGIVFFGINLWLMRRFGGASIRAILAAISPSLVSGLSAAAAGWLFLTSGVVDGWPDLAALVATGMVSTAVAVALLMTTEPHARSLYTDMRRTIGAHVSSSNRHPASSQGSAPAGQRASGKA
jgi:PST family polysaccharide transporter